MKKYYFIWYNHIEGKIQVEFASAINEFEAARIVTLNIKMKSNNSISYSTSDINMIEIQDEDFKTMKGTQMQLKKFVEDGFFNPKLFTNNGGNNG